MTVATLKCLREYFKCLRNINVLKYGWTNVERYRQTTLQKIKLFSQMSWAASSLHLDSLKAIAEDIYFEEMKTFDFLDSLSPTWKQVLE